MNGKESIENHRSPAHDLYKGPTVNNHTQRHGEHGINYHVPELTHNPRTARVQNAYNTSDRPQTIQDILI